MLVSIITPFCVLSNSHNHNHKNTSTSIQIGHYQSIPAGTNHANAEQDDTVKINKSIMVRRIVRSTATTVAGAGGGDHCCAPATGTWSGVV